jgi:dihydrofolate synthase / folylpolyglutamate synthase
MNFDEALQYLLGLGHETLAIKLGLRNTELLLKALHNPERSFPSVQIAGTNGKGSTAVYLDSICGEAGIRTGLYTSPHLESITERIKIHGQEISPEDFALYASLIRQTSERLVSEGQIEALPTFFEQVTAIALVAFREKQVELAILETGLGGRLDSTTAANARVCAITQIGFDHEEYLGSELASIAAEKAAIIRPGVSVVVATQQPEALAVILKRCEEVGVTPILVRDEWEIEGVTTDGRARISLQTNRSRFNGLSLGLRGRHQIENVAVAIHLSELLQDQKFFISQKAIVDGVQKASHPGRLELFKMRPMILLDGAHNPAGAKALREFLNEFAKRPLTIVFGAMRDKQLEEIARLIFPAADHIVLTSIQNPRAASLEILNSISQPYASGTLTSTRTSAEAVEQALRITPPEGMICVTGSLYLIGEVRKLIQRLGGSPI